MIAFLLMLAAVIGAAELWSLRRGLEGVEYDQRVSKAIAEPDEPLQLIRTCPTRWSSRATCGWRTSGDTATPCGARPT